MGKVFRVVEKAEGFGGHGECAGRLVVALLQRQGGAEILGCCGERLPDAEIPQGGNALAVGVFGTAHEAEPEIRAPDRVTRIGGEGRALPAHQGQFGLGQLGWPRRSLPVRWRAR